MKYIDYNVLINLRGFIILLNIWFIIKGIKKYNHLRAKTVNS